MLYFTIKNLMYSIKFYTPIQFDMSNMKKLFFAAILFMQDSSFAQTTTWKNDKMHSKLTFTVTHLLISDVYGLFKNFDANVSFYS